MKNSILKTVLFFWNFSWIFLSGNLLKIVYLFNKYYTIFWSSESASMLWQLLPDVLTAGEIRPGIKTWEIFPSTCLSSFISKDPFSEIIWQILIPEIWDCILITLKLSPIIFLMLSLSLISFVAYAILIDRSIAFWSCFTSTFWSCFYWVFKLSLILCASSNTFWPSTK